jgi:hypothetical protein
MAAFVIAYTEPVFRLVRPATEAMLMIAPFVEALSAG